MDITALSLPPLTGTGEVVTFYSYKGGTGRTMALSNIAVLLARQQNATTPVLMIDWDLEAPGLHHYFDHHDEGPGVLELFEACREQLMRRRKGTAALLDEEELAREVLAAVGWEQYVSRVDQSSQLYLMRAGRFDDSYGERLAAMHWDELFNSCPALFRSFADNLARHFRYVLVDSRTGRTDSAGICTTLLPRKLVVVFTPNRQSLEGVQALVTRATAYRRSHEDEQRPLLVYPLPSRIEMGDSAQRAQWRRGDQQQRILGYQPIFEQLLCSCYGMSQMSLDSYFDEVQLQQTRTFAYGEQLAVRMDQGGDRFSLTRTFEAFLDWLGGGYFPWQSSREIHLLASIGDARRALEDGGVRALSQPLARDLNLLGELYRREGRLRQALACFEESMSLRQRGLGEDHPDTLASKSNLAGVLRVQGQLDEAQFLEECIVEARERLLGREHLDTLAARANLAATLAEQGRAAEALAMLDAVLDAYLRLLGSEHLLTLACKASRADMLFRRGDSEHARIAQEQVLAARKRLLGAEHADTLRSKTALGCTLLRMQELEAAGSLFEAVLQAQIRRLGPDHLDTRKARAQLADVQVQLGGPVGGRMGEPALVPELHQDAAGADYGDALSRPPLPRERPGASDLWTRAAEELLALDGHLSASRPPSR
ncbi:tetratricopeptide repeat protein [Duganella violaceipulchra]|uniref:Tetratricopeptide (TPR) repeat protein n=1 Tax=Duganella violaceipulchra TaxID=2849652 RepID=A0AA41L7L4_9BURK|nr:tetratricopeptide repeat protein [Duganella violaceicalia]MBV6324462.1 tetratricopeptide repeat protein [Duganella violaceicalia]MCP2012066.1 tetratricopeptide (TPR) repeat protein [Duganella violaceicalia]